jgi:hypothetical protein
MAGNGKGFPKILYILDTDPAPTPSRGLYKSKAENGKGFPKILYILDNRPSTLILQRALKIHNRKG